jgi:hypothetical protein
MGDILRQLTEAIESADESRYAISKSTGISESHLSKLMDGSKGMSLEKIETLSRHLGYEFTLKKLKRKR